MGGHGIPEAEMRIAGLEERIAAEVTELHRRAHGHPRGGPPGVRYLFVCGCPRSGTTSVATLLNEDRRIIIGQERYRLIRKIVEPFLFREELFFNPSLRETSWATPVRRERVFPGSPADYRTLRERWRSGDVLVLGDKAPFYHRVLPRLADAFADPCLVFVLRDLAGVVRSYLHRARDPADHWPAENDHTLAVAHFNEALANLKAMVDGRGSDSVHILRYEDFHGGRAGTFEALYARLGLEPTGEVRAAYSALVDEHDDRRRADAPLEDDIAEFVEAHRDRALERWAHERGRAPAAS